MPYFTVRHRSGFGRALGPLVETFNVPPLAARTAEREGLQVIPQTHAYTPEECKAISRAKAQEERERFDAGLLEGLEALARDAHGRRRLAESRIARFHSKR